jgi:ParB family chromosome partitioning protein
VSLASVRPELRQIPIAFIDKPELPSRTTMDDEKMAELVGSMRTIGFISILVVVQVGERYEVVAGHRRSIAAGLAGIAIVPCLVYPSKDDAVEAVQHAENKHREDLNAADEAIWFQQLFDKYPDEGTDGVAARVSESRAYVEGRLALFQGDELIFEALAAGRITIGVAQQLNRCPHEMYRRSLLDQALHSHATVATVSSWIADYKRTMEPALRDVPGNGAPVTTGIAIQTDYFTCQLCSSKDNPANMRPVNVHDYCIQAVLVPALALWNGRGDAVQFPRTLREAHALIDRLIERFPEIVPDDSAPA